MVFRSGEGLVNVTRHDVDHFPTLSHHLFSLRVMADQGHEYQGNKESVSVFLDSDPRLFLPSKGNLNGFFSYQDQ